jgi:hypothetical protein
LSSVLSFAQVESNNKLMKNETFFFTI